MWARNKLFSTKRPNTESLNHLETSTIQAKKFVTKDDYLPTLTIYFFTDSKMQKWSNSDRTMSESI